jgi:thiamine biosynthesis lipoprotein
MTIPADRRSRRELLTPKTGNSPSGTSPPLQTPSGGVTVRLTTRAMACDFSVIMNPGPTDHIEAAGSVLELVHSIEGWLSIYKAESQLSRINQHAARDPQTVRGDLFELLIQAKTLFERTEGAFDLASGALTALWKSCRRDERIPNAAEIAECLEKSGMQHVELRPENLTVTFHREGIVLDPGAIGKGFALDEGVSRLLDQEAGPKSFLLHGGHSSLKAVGGHHGHPGWPVGIGNPLFTNQRLGTLLLCNNAMATSGSNIQFYRHEGRRYGHILDPRTGWPIDGMLSVTVLAPSAAIADALSTAFFVMGIEKARVCCENWPGIGVILIPFPVQGRKVQPTVIGIPEDQIFWDENQVDL